MNRHIAKLILGSALTATLCSCSATQKVLYLPEAEDIPTEVLATVNSTPANARLMPGDLLNIRVYGEDAAAVAPFNKGQFVQADGSVTTLQVNNATNNEIQTATDLYLVDSDGDITMPMLGRLHVSGLTATQVADDIAAAICPRFVKTKPTVEVRLANFSITMLGEVKNPGRYVIDNGRVNVLEAIAMAGDLDIKGDRESVMLYRTNADGSREIHRLNLNDRNLLLSPYFTLQQNDLLYIEPNKSQRQNAWQLPTGWTTTLSVVGGASSLAGLIIGIVNLSK